MKTNSLRDKRTGGEKGEWLGAVGVREWNCAVQSVQLRWCVWVCARVGTRGRLCCAEAVGLAWALVWGDGCVLTHRRVYTGGCPGVCMEAGVEVR